MDFAQAHCHPAFIYLNLLTTVEVEIVAQCLHRCSMVVVNTALLHDFQERLHRAIDFTVPLAFVPSHTDEVYEDKSGEILYDFIEP